MLKNKIQLSIFEDLIGFIVPFMNGALSYVANRKEPQGTVQNDFYRQKGVGARKFH